MRARRVLVLRFLESTLMLALGCVPVEPEPQAVSKTPGGIPDQVAHDVTQVVTRDGRKRAEIDAGRLLKFELSRLSRLEGGVTVRFYGGSGKLVSTLTCDRAMIDEGSRIFTAVDSVVLVSYDATVLHTDTLRWEEGTEKVFGPSRVTIDRKEGREVGVGFEAESDLSSWTLMEVVTTFVSPDSER